MFIGHNRLWKERSPRSCGWDTGRSCPEKFVLWQCIQVLDTAVGTDVKYGNTSNLSLFLYRNSS